MCGAACVNTNIDDMHCGACDTACPADERCAGGVCR
jgi:hypothetical protein